VEFDETLGAAAGALAVLSLGLEGALVSFAASFPDSDAHLDPESDPESAAGSLLLAA
jgi:hypothetical protein